MDVQNISGSDIVVSPAATTTYRLLRVRDANNCEILSPSPNLIGTATVSVRALPAITAQPVSRHKLQASWKRIVTLVGLRLTNPILESLSTISTMDPIWFAIILGKVPMGCLKLSISVLLLVKPINWSSSTRICKRTSRDLSTRQRNGTRSLIFLNQPRIQLPFSAMTAMGMYF